MISIDKLIIVEGKYDKIKLSNFIKGNIIQTDGFGIYKNKKMLEYIKKFAISKGIIIVTDSDRAGYKIRNYIKSCMPKGSNIQHIYTPDLFGKEKRKREISKEGKIGVEGMSQKVLKEAFKTFEKEDILNEQDKKKITKMDLYQDGFIGCDGSRKRREALFSILDIPENIGNNSVCEAINSLISFEEYIEIKKKI
ncbi:MAG: DUF4093 domain-containing protein [Oscillospiraceae bacterium]|nr:DUF4093 domain-containing protein [Oscillospiraceae bacterium]